MKTIALFSAVLFLAVAVACSGDEKADTPTTPTASRSVVTPKVTTPKPTAPRTLGSPPRTPTRVPVGPPPGASAICNDGTYSYSQHRRGTCSHHRGVARWLKDLPP